MVGADLTGDTQKAVVVDIGDDVTNQLGLVGRNVKKADLLGEIVL